MYNLTTDSVSMVDFYILRRSTARAAYLWPPSGARVGDDTPHCGQPRTLRRRVQAARGRYSAKL
jgi:hypothetical protein